MAYDIYDQVTARILQELERGALPWVKPWADTPGANIPCNAATGRPYSGSNTVLLWMAATGRGWPTPRFLTFRQAKEAGGTVKAGEHGSKVCFWKSYVAKDRSPDADPDAVRKALAIREFVVFNVAQCSGLPNRITDGPPMRVRNPDTRDELADAYLASTGAKFVEGAGAAFYMPSQDVIMMPAFVAFKNSDHFYHTGFHELTHWTGHKDRCERDFKGRFGDAAYAAEELVAELGASFQCAEFGFNGDVRDAGYVAHWIRLLKHDKRAFFTSASAAQKAVDYLRGKALEEGEEREAA